MDNHNKISPIELALFAPNNHSAMVIGSFSDWEDIPMEKGADGFFRVNIDLTDGEHRYRFRVQSKSWFYEPDQWVTVVDPYATNVDAEDECTVLQVLNGLKIVDTYQWRHDHHQLPGDRQLVIYEMHVGDFSGGESDSFPRGAFDDVVDKLDYLADLGVNAIELMPVKECPGKYGWGYNPKYLMASESMYGSTQQLKRLIDECHGRGIRVIMDFVLNHSDTESPLAQIDHNYWYHREPKDLERSWGPEFNYDLRDERLNVMPARQFIGDVVRFWIREYHIDGIRFDAAKQINNFDFLRWIVSEARKVSAGKPFYNIAEYIPTDPAVCGPDGPMDGCWHESFRFVVTDALVGEVNFERLKNVLDARRVGFSGATAVVNYLSNHDQERVFAQLGEKGIFGQDAFQRVRLGMTLLLTAVGVPMLWMGDEFGVFSPKVPGQNKLDWQLLAGAKSRSLHAYVRSLIQLRVESAALQSDDINFIHEDRENRVLSYLRGNEKTGQVAAVLNFSEKSLARYRTPGFPEDGIWREWTNAYEVEVCDGGAILDLSPFGACLLVRQG